MFNDQRVKDGLGGFVEECSIIFHHFPSFSIIFHLMVIRVSGDLFDFFLLGKATVFPHFWPHQAPVAALTVRRLWDPVGGAWKSSPWFSFRFDGFECPAIKIHKSYISWAFPIINNYLTYGENPWCHRLNFWYLCSRISHGHMWLKPEHVQCLGSKCPFNTPKTQRFSGASWTWIIRDGFQRHQFRSE